MLDVINYPKLELLEKIKITQSNNIFNFSLDMWANKINKVYLEING